MEKTLGRMTVSQAAAYGQPGITGTRIFFCQALESPAAGVSPADLTSRYFPPVTDKDVRECSCCAAHLKRDRFRARRTP